MAGAGRGQFERVHVEAAFVTVGDQTNERVLLETSRGEQVADEAAGCARVPVGGRGGGAC